MKIVFVADEIDALGGIQRVIHTLAQILTDRGMRVCVVGLHRVDRPITYTEDSKYEQHVLDAPRDPSHHRCLKESQTRMQDILSRYHDGFVVMSSPRVVAWMSALNLAGFRTIAVYHGSFEFSRTHYHFDFIREHFAALDLSAFTSIEDATSFAEHTGLRNTAWLPNPLSFTPARGEAATGRARPPRVLAAGRLTAIKRFEHLITAFSLIPDSLWELHIVGDGEDEEKLRRLASQVGPSGARIKFRGLVPSSLMPAEYAAAEILALTSEHEGLVTVVAEAAASSIPSVAYDISGGVRSMVISGETGVLVPSGDIEKFAAELHELMADKPRRRRLGQQAKRHIQFLAPQSVADQWVRTLEEL